MQGSADDRPLGRVVRSVRATDWAGKAKGVVSALKDQYHAGRQGEELPVQPLWPSPKEQLTALKGLLRSAPNRTDPPTDEATDAEAAQLADAMRGVNWADVRAATAERTSDVAQSMRTMAEHVDWAKVQPVAAQVSSALIAAMAAGRIPVGGPLGPILARAINDQNNLARRVAHNLQQTPATAPPDFRHVIEATSTDG